MSSWGHGCSNGLCTRIYRWLFLRLHTRRAGYGYADRRAPEQGGDTTMTIGPATVLDHRGGARHTALVDCRTAGVARLGRYVPVWPGARGCGASRAAD